MQPAKRNNTKVAPLNKRKHNTMNTLIYSITPFRDHFVLSSLLKYIMWNNQGKQNYHLVALTDDLALWKSKVKGCENLNWTESHNTIAVTDGDAVILKLTYGHFFKAYDNVPAFVENARNGIESGIVIESEKHMQFFRQDLEPDGSMTETKLSKDGESFKSEGTYLIGMRNTNQDGSTTDSFLETPIRLNNFYSNDGN